MYINYTPTIYIYTHIYLLYNIYLYKHTYTILPYQDSPNALRPPPSIPRPRIVVIRRTSLLAWCNGRETPVFSKHQESLMGRQVLELGWLGWLVGLVGLVGWVGWVGLVGLVDLSLIIWWDTKWRTRKTSNMKLTYQGALQIGFSTTSPGSSKPWDSKMVQWQTSLCGLEFTPETAGGFFTHHTILGHIRHGFFGGGKNYKGQLFDGFPNSRRCKVGWGTGASRRRSRSREAQQRCIDLSLGAFWCFL